MSSASTETPEEFVQYIYVEETWVPKFVAVFLKKGYWIDLQFDRKAVKWRLRFAVNVDLRRDFPTALHGKFSINP